MSDATAVQPLTLAVKFGGFGATDNTRALGFSTPRTEETRLVAEDTFIDRLLECRLECDPLGGDDVEGQQTMELSQISLKVVCGSTSFRTSAKQYSGRLIFDEECDLTALVRFCKRRGTITILSATPREMVGG